VIETEEFSILAL